MKGGVIYLWDRIVQHNTVQCRYSKLSVRAVRTFQSPFSVLCRFFDGWGLSDEVNIPSPDREGEREGGRE
jgi:hypothetical protein